MGATRKTRNQQKKQLSQLNETLNHVVIGSNTKVSVIEMGLWNFKLMINIIFEREPWTLKSVQVKIRSLEKNIDHKIRRAVDNAVKTIEKKWRA